MDNNNPQNQGASSSKLMDEIDQTIEQAERQIRETKTFFKKVGLNQGMAKQILSSGQFDQDLLKSVREEFNSQMNELNRKPADAGGTASTGETDKPRKAMKMHRMSI